MRRTGRSEEQAARRTPRNLSNPLFSRALAALIVLAGSAGALGAARSVAHGAAQLSLKTFDASTTQAAATLKLALTHENDLVVSAQAFVLDNPRATEQRFAQFVRSVRAMERYPELRGIGVARIVPASGLRAFSMLPTVQTANGATPRIPFVVVPPGHRAFYCFSAIGVNRNEQVGLPPGFDLCAGRDGRVMLATRGSGLIDVEPLTVGKSTTLSLAVPIYRYRAAPSTPAERTAAFLGWVGMSVNPSVILEAALQGHPATAVALRFTADPAVAFRAGPIPSHFHSASVDLHDGWTIELYGAAVGGGVFGDSNALALLVAGVAISLLLGALIYALGSGRTRAMDLVRVRTGQLRYQALHDSLTGLPNRLLILDRTEQMLARAHRSHLPAAAMFLDIDDFKDINDTLGHQAGDQLLAAVGQRLAAALREGDTVGRLGGDEFVVLVEGASLRAGAEVVADRLLDVLRPPFRIAASELPLSIFASIGIAAGDRGEPGDLLRNADIALYQAKRTGKRRAVIFAPSMQVDAKNHRDLEVDLHNALDAGQFFVLYQPTIDLQTDAFIGVEALLRWQHPERGVVQPDDFVPALEASGLIVAVGAWVLETACRQGAAWHARGHHFTVSVNVSAKQLAQAQIVDDVKRALTLSGFNPATLMVELTESTLMDDVPETITQLELLKALGVRIAIDDFGTGYSSLAYLRKFPVDVIKIDRGFVSGMVSSAEAAALVHTLVQLGKVLKLQTIAEGVEDDDQRRHLQAEEVDAAQGFLFSRALDVAGVDRYLENHLPVSRGAARTEMVTEVRARA